MKFPIVLPIIANICSLLSPMSQSIYCNNNNSNNEERKKHATRVCLEKFFIVAFLCWMSREIFSKINKNNNQQTITNKQHEQICNGKPRRNKSMSQLFHFLCSDNFVLISSWFNLFLYLYWWSLLHAIFFYLFIYLFYLYNWLQFISIH